MRAKFMSWAGVLVGLCAAGCGSDEGLPSDGPGTRTENLVNRAYIVSRDSGELTVIDLSRLEIVARVPTGGISNHMAELNRDFTKLYIDSSETDESVVVDAKTLQVTKRIVTGKHPTHLSLSRDGRVLAIMNEDDNSVSLIDPDRDVELKRLEGFHTPHFMRFSQDGRFAYVANIGAYHLTRVSMSSLAIDGHIALDGHQGPPNATAASDEGGFGDAQIDASGMLYAAHKASGRVLVYDTIQGQKRPDLKVGKQPWIAFAEHPFKDVPLKHLVPNFGDSTLSLIDGSVPLVASSLPGDEEAYGVNFSSRAPNKAFVMNRIRKDIAVVDTARGEITTRIPVGGNTETASTTPDGKWIVATVSDANRVVVIDAETNAVVKTFENVGVYPWSVTIPGGQNYCH
jgi:YVTN family beta-propeller protein